MKYYLCLVLFFVYCSDGSTPITGKKKEGFHKHFSAENKGSFVLWFITRDPYCFPTDQLTKYSKITLQSSQKVTSSNYTTFGIPLSQSANVKPITLRITLLNDGCTLTRNISYCSNYNKVDFSTGTNAGIACNAGQSALSTQTIGNTGSFVDCTLSFFASNIRLDVTSTCNYEIYYQ